MGRGGWRNINYIKEKAKKFEKPTFSVRLLSLDDEDKGRPINIKFMDVFYLHKWGL